MEGRTTLRVRSLPDGEAIRLYVCGLPETWTEADVRSNFCVFGQIYLVDLVKRPCGEANSGSCYITYYSRQSSMDAQVAWNKCKTFENRKPIQMRIAEKEGAGERTMTLEPLPATWKCINLWFHLTPFGLLEECGVIDSGGEPSGYAIFAARSQMLEAIESLQGKSLTHEQDSRLRISFKETKPQWQDSRTSCGSSPAHPKLKIAERTVSLFVPPGFNPLPPRAPRARMSTEKLVGDVVDSKKSQSNIELQTVVKPIASFAPPPAESCDNAECKKYFVSYSDVVKEKSFKPITPEKPESKPDVVQESQQLLLHDLSIDPYSSTPVPTFLEKSSYAYDQVAEYGAAEGWSISECMGSGGDCAWIHEELPEDFEAELMREWKPSPASANLLSVQTLGFSSPRIQDNVPEGKSILASVGTNTTPLRTSHVGVGTSPRIAEEIATKDTRPGKNSSCQKEVQVQTDGFFDPFNHQMTKNPMFLDYPPEHLLRNEQHGNFTGSNYGSGYSGYSNTSRPCSYPWPRGNCNNSMELGKMVSGGQNYTQPEIHQGPSPMFPNCCGFSPFMNQGTGTFPGSMSDAPYINYPSYAGSYNNANQNYQGNAMHYPNYNYCPSLIQNANPSNANWCAPPPGIGGCPWPTSTNTNSFGAGDTLVKSRPVTGCQYSSNVLAMHQSFSMTAGFQDLETGNTAGTTSVGNSDTRDRKLWRQRSK